MFCSSTSCDAVRVPEVYARLITEEMGTTTGSLNLDPLQERLKRGLKYCSKRRRSDAFVSLASLLRDSQAALPVLARATVEDDTNYAAYLNMGKYLSDVGRLDDAVAVTRRAIKLNSTYALAHRNLGSLLKLRGSGGAGNAETAESERAYRKALTLDPKDPEIYQGLGDLFISLSQYDKAIAVLSEALKVHPTNAKFLRSLANTYLIKGNHTASLQVRRRRKLF